MKANAVSALLPQEQRARVLLASLPYIIILTLISTFSSVTIGKTTQNDLVIYNWEDFMPEAVLDDFYEATGYKVRQVYFTSEREARELILENRGKGMDLMVTSRYELNVLLNQTDIFAPIPYADLKNLLHLDPIWKIKSASVLDISVPWVWGTTGILYRKDLVELDTITWMDLMSPPLASKGKVMMIPSVRDVIATALLALNESINTNDEATILHAGKLLQSQKDEVAAYQFLVSEIVVGQIHMSLSYSSDAAEFLALDDNIAYVLPNDKTTVWLNSLAVFQSSDKKDIAFQFIDFVNEPKRAAYIAEYLATSSANKAATAYFSEEYLSEPSLNVPSNVLESAEMYEVLSPETTSKYNAIYYNVLRSEL
ncbi:MAG: spermidine/putrescine transport system substrate-binding protein [Alphaproteobacteria bacterium]|jgi:spermidine/putrescine transport system substrate-binding protein